MYRFEFEKQTYPSLADQVGTFIQKRMVDEYNLKIKKVPFKEDLTEPETHCRAPIFISPDWSRNTKRALVLIQGMGEVRAGLWARKASINHSLEIGSMLPQIKFAVENDMAILILNPNFERNQNGNPVDSLVSTKESHWNYVFKKFVKNRTIAEEIFIIAHSYGGRCCAGLISKFTDEFHDRVKAIAFTDSSSCKVDTVDKEEEEWINNHCKAYVASDKALGKKEKSKIFRSNTISFIHILSKDLIHIHIWQII